ncbi:beta-ribofuranosylaminobenzene 5'-phosphate synthase family protein [Aurantimonas sp. 22II-16-19i]|uniref:beta-ribofuranosylaminobenzene 5'-phosphate synthase family protein n=1 Tax=Aurantimonas sp. 22II-16-19i TaxID=1317114 RepID=UPI0009F7CBED|nr:beta-ribofuranosylaminobenzene 5'-phosphate synthase family protein [Aurantimonas sp. 22II-16-19i]ORE98714.1 beta-ribofuranosylaminobenzene 5'-phosphate synthase [Aurantimonas sp. 22II-16-19i]
MSEDVVTVSAPARLHLGFLDPGGSLGRRFGGIGLALEAPCTTVEISRGERDMPEVEGAARGGGRAGAYLARLRDALRLDAAYRLAVTTEMPAHSGLGSGTQLALAVACGLRRLEGLDLDPEADAALLGRGNRSGLGVAFVTGGGVAVDGGKGETELPPPLIARLPFPEGWRVILVMDPRVEGFHGEAELEAFADLPPFAESDAARICQLVLMRALPGLMERDLAAFGGAISEIQEKVGAHFAAAQGGVFTSAKVSAACRWLERHGAHGIGQSSWGPTGFAFAPDQDSAERLLAGLNAAGLCEGLDIRIVKGRNRGIEINRRSEAGTGAVTRRLGTG